MNLVLKLKSFFRRNKYFCWGLFFKKRKAIGLEIFVDFFQKHFVLERAWFCSICSENTIIELSFEIEVVFSEKQYFCWGQFFKKRKAIGLEKSSISSKKNFVLERVWFGSICCENTIIKLSFEIEEVFSKKQLLLLGSILQ